MSEKPATFGEKPKKGAGKSNRSGGRLKKSSRWKFDESLQSSLKNIEDPLDRRIHTLHWRFERFAQVLPSKNIIRYEDVISSDGRALSVITPDAAGLDEHLENKNLNELYDRDMMLTIGERLLASEGAYWNFYSHESVEKLLEDIS